MANKFSRGSNNSNGEGKIDFKKIKIIADEAAIKPGESGMNILMSSYPISGYGEIKESKWSKYVTSINNRVKLLDKIAKALKSGKDCESIVKMLEEYKPLPKGFKEVLRIEEVENIDYEQFDDDSIDF